EPARQRKEYILVGGGNRRNAHVVTFFERRDDFFDQHLGRRRAGRNPDAARPIEARPVDLGGGFQQHRVRTAGPFRDLLEALRVRRIWRSDHDERIDVGGDALDRLLAVGGGVANVFLVRPDDRGE